MEDLLMRYKSFLGYFILYFFFLLSQFIMIITFDGIPYPFPDMILKGFFVYTFLSGILFIVAAIIHMRFDSNIHVRDNEKPLNRFGKLNLKKKILLVAFSFLFLLVFSAPIGSYKLYHKVWIYRTIKISTANDLQSVCKYPKANYYLTQDLDLSQLKINNAYINCRFEGTFNGKERTIFNLTQPLILENNGKVENIHFKSVHVEVEYDKVGTVARINNGGSIEKIVASGNVSGNLNVGGIVGENTDGTIRNVTVNGIITGNMNVGGIVGKNTDGIIQKVTVNGTITGKSCIGGISGDTTGGSIAEAYVAGSIQGIYLKDNWEGKVLGGISGLHRFTTVTNNFIEADISGYQYIGGIAGYSAKRSIYHNIFTGHIKGTHYIDFMNGYHYNDLFEEMIDMNNLFLGTIEGYDHEFDNVLFLNNASISQYNIPEKKLVTSDQLKNKLWYIETMGLNEIIWNFDSVDQDLHPTLQWLVK
jgi:M26 IgA1-specific Metallo-endopeptidase N-terminal region/The GLUG motif